MKKALILGVGGQDGSYLADILVGKEYEVHGLYRRSSVNNLIRIQHLLDTPYGARVILHQGDMADLSSVERAIAESRLGNEDEIYNVADQDHVGFSHNTAAYSADITYGAVARTLDTLVRRGLYGVKFFQPLSSTIYGDRWDTATSYKPDSPYACAKLAAKYLCEYYRDKHGLFVACAILYNHDSLRRGPNYLLQKICRWAREVESRLPAAPLPITGTDLGIQVDIGYAKEYMEAAVSMMQLDKPTTLTIATGEPRSIWYMCYEALNEVEAGWYKLPPEPEEKGFYPHYRSALKETEEAIGFSAKTQIDQLIKMIIHCRRSVV